MGSIGVNLQGYLSIQGRPQGHQSKNSLAPAGVASEVRSSWEGQQGESKRNALIGEGEAAGQPCHTEQFCHAERSEASRRPSSEALRGVYPERSEWAQGDNTWPGSKTLRSAQGDNTGNEMQALLVFLAALARLD